MLRCCPVVCECGLLLGVEGAEVVLLAAVVDLSFPHRFLLAYAPVKPEGPVCVVRGLPAAALSRREKWLPPIGPLPPDVSGRSEQNEGGEDDPRGHTGHFRH